MMRRVLATAAVLTLTFVGSGTAQGFRPSTRLMGFADISYVATDRPTDAGFRQGQLVGHIVSELNDRAGFFSEISASATSSGYRIEVERLILRYAFRDEFKLSAGRFHTPISYWNTAYHHGHWLQTSVGRPEMIRGGGTFLPVHYVGMVAEGTMPTSLGLSYLAGVGNGRNETFVRAGDAGEKDARLAYNGGLRIRPAALPGLEAGASVLLDRPRSADSVDVRERIATVHVALDRDDSELIAEHAWVTHSTDATSGWVTGRGWYVQAGYRLPGMASSFKPYARLEAVNVPVRDPMSPNGTSYRAWLGGMRYDFTSVAALKAEYRREQSALQRFVSLILELSFTFPGASSEPVADPVPIAQHGTAGHN